MPIYEFKCLKCQTYFEMLVMNNDEEVELKCPECKSEDFERIISSTNFAMGDSSDSSNKLSATTRTCSTGSCTTYEIPGHSR
ncbi:MAG: zinc ribbon domain-containing protein [Deltaproteobacteria bacterium]|jgi:putative FmdB family regulatory protein|nr:zinc ribbon domain-containing protein [Deltaproteobacteria bacterium]